jgi:hypothetical protein
MSQVGFEPTIQIFERATAVIGINRLYRLLIKVEYLFLFKVLFINIYS